MEEEDIGKEVRKAYDRFEKKYAIYRNPLSSYLASGRSSLIYLLGHCMDHWGLLGPSNASDYESYFVRISKEWFTCSVAESLSRYFGGGDRPYPDLLYDLYREHRQREEELHRIYARNLGDEAEVEEVAENVEALQALKGMMAPTPDVVKEQGRQWVRFLLVGLHPPEGDPFLGNRRAMLYDLENQRIT